ncbi:MAG TPA: serine--tRNA ligase [Anaerolineales bacterium]|nr:serine--tRNA ligase [Anaerolineales bacterium]HRQ93080.1 serine--tRNA ligase [Anaerolineales bacterium]
MLDITLIRETPEVVKAGLVKRNMDPALVDTAASLDARRRELLVEVEALKAERNAVSKEISTMQDKAAKEARIVDMRAVGDKIGALDTELAAIDADFEAAISVIPNIVEERVPAGGEENNIVAKQWGDKPTFSFEAKPHWELGEQLGIIDFEAGVRVTGSRFYVLSGAGARLQRALISWMLDLHSRQGYTEKYTPFMVKGATLYGAGQLPKFKDNLYKDAEEDLYMIPTAEVPLTGLHMGEILGEEQLPLRYTAYSPCFRREKMSAGRDVRGIKRGHQFDKVEMYKFTTPEQSEAEFEQMVADAEATCQALGLPYRLLLKAAGDTSESAHISYDIEIWAAGCNEWLEVSSISKVGDFQARRAGIKYRAAGEKGSRFLHTINGSGLGLPRTLIGVLENYQQADGSVSVPEVLRPWMGGIERIAAEE